MKVALLTNIVSPHQLPLAEEIVKLVGAENYRYAYTEPFHEERAKMGWGDGSAHEWCQPVSLCRDFLETADLVYCEERDIDLLEKRLAVGKKTFYVSERWFKPILLPHGISFPGWFKLLCPRYFKMAKRFIGLFGYSGFRYLPQGPWAEKDMKAICRLFWQKYDESQFVPWGYFVAPSSAGERQRTYVGNHVRVLWVGRMLEWKRIDTIVKAIRSLHDKSSEVQITLTLVGNGAQRRKIENLVKGDARLRIIDSIPISDVRNLMHSHDVYVLASNAEEGWGAALNEALEEGMLALGTYEAGASAAMLPKSHLFHAGDWRALSALLLKAANGEIGPTGIGDWTAQVAAKKVVESRRMKRIVKQLVLFLGSVFAHDASPKVVFYHDIGQKWTSMGTPVDLFEEHVTCLRKGDLVCFDDGFRGIWENRNRVGRIECVVVFLAVGLVGRSGYLTWDEIRELQNNYGVEFQCHTWSHQTLAGPWNAEVAVPEAGRTEEWYKHELVDSKAELERQLGKKVTALCFPVGYFTDDVIHRCKEAGYEKVYASYPGDMTDGYIQPRCLVQNMSVLEFRCVLNGGMNWLQLRYLLRHKVG